MCIDNIFVMFLAAIYLKWEFQIWSVFFLWHKSMWFFLISRFLRSKYAPLVLYSSLVCWLLFSFCYWSMPKLSEALHGLVFNFSKECYNADTLLCVSYWASFTAENYCYNKTHILISQVFPDSSLKMLLFSSFIVSKIYN